MRERRWPRTERVGEGEHAYLLEGAEDREVLGGEPGLEAQGVQGAFGYRWRLVGSSREGKELRGRQMGLLG